MASLDKQDGISGTAESPTWPVADVQLPCVWKMLWFNQICSKLILICLYARIYVDPVEMNVEDKELLQILKGKKCIHTYM